LYDYKASLPDGDKAIFDRLVDDNWDEVRKPLLAFPPLSGLKEYCRALIESGECDKKQALRDLDKIFSNVEDRRIKLDRALILKCAELTAALRLALFFETVKKCLNKLRSLKSIQDHFHELIIRRTQGLCPLDEFELPDLLTAPDDLIHHPIFLTIPGMYGGFSYWLQEKNGETVLISESWCRVGEGSEERYEISASTCRQIE